VSIGDTISYGDTLVF